MAESPSDPDTTIDPYETLGITSDADDASVRSAYKKLALKHHPDKVSPNDRASAHQRFQNIAFAYAVLSDPKRRKRYDTTGSTAESALDDEDFDWADFFKARYTEITKERLHEFQKQYKGGDEERRDLLKAYTKHGGRMDRVYEFVMLSNPLDDEERFQEIIGQAIESGEVEGFDAFLQESEASKKRRMNKARKEAKEAEDYAEELELEEGKEKRKTRKKLKGDVEVNGDASSDEDEGEGDEQEDGEGSDDEGDVDEEEDEETDNAEPEPEPKIRRGKGRQSKKEPPVSKTKKPAPKTSRGGGLGDLAAMISQRQQNRASTFLDDLEAKYAPKSKNKKRAPMDEPSEEAFARTAARRGSKRSKS